MKEFVQMPDSSTSHVLFSLSKLPLLFLSLYTRTLFGCVFLLRSCLFITPHLSCLLFHVVAHPSAFLQLNDLLPALDDLQFCLLMLVNVEKSKTVNYMLHKPAPASKMPLSHECSRQVTVTEALMHRPYHILARCSWVLLAQSDVTSTNRTQSQNPHLSPFSSM